MMRSMGGRCGQWWRRVVAALCVVGVAMGTARADRSVAVETVAQFRAFCEAMGVVATDEPTLTRTSTWVKATAGDWTLVVDVSGNRTFRPTESLPRIGVSQKGAVSQFHEKLPVSPGARTKLGERSRKLALALVGVPFEEIGRGFVKREIIVVGASGRRGLERYAGRCLVRLSWNGRGYFQVMYAPDGGPLRIDTDIRDAASASLVRALGRNEVEPGIAAYQEDRGQLSVGTFFDPGEMRFEVRAYSFESVEFLKLAQEENPFGDWPCEAWKTYPPNTEAVLRSDAYRHACWDLWREYGRTGAVRGNWLGELGRFEHDGVEIRHHKSFGDYSIVGGEPSKRVDFKGADGKVYQVPSADAAQLERRFYDDVEQCDVAHFNAHGGQTRGRYRFRRNPHVWVKFDPPRPLGSGSLRHLLLEGCNTMNYVESPNKPVIFDTWLDGKLAGGVRTICGSDGGRAGWTSAGWRFYGRYNKGDSISDAWAIRNWEENPQNDPVTIAYGRTRAAALRTLFDGRFSRVRAKPTWVAASVWTTPPKP